MKRRNFLKNTGVAISLPILLNGMPVSAVAKSALFKPNNLENDNVLVLIQLNGGNDGLNSLIPLDQYSNLMKFRENIIIPESSIIGLTDSLGLHPNMGAFKSIYDEGKLGIVHDVGYPNQNRSHFRSRDVWTSASPSEEVWQTGWVGRYLEELHPGFPDAYPNESFPDPLAITLGKVVSETCQGTGSNFSLTLDDPFSLSPLSEGAGGEVPNNFYGDELKFLRTTLLQTNAYSEVILEAANAGNNTVDYPETNLAQQLKTVALMVSGGLKTKVYIVNLGGFDTHAEQVLDGDPTAGEHAELLRTLSEAIDAFQKDLTGLGLEEKVLSMTFSEFGRQIRSNFSFGTDHGTAAPLFLFGSCVNPQILGNNPDIPDEVEVQEGVPMQYDFRDVYGSVLMDWFEVEEKAIKSLLHEEFKYLPIVRSCSQITSTEEWWKKQEALNIEAYPNPFRDWITVSFATEGEWVRLSLFDAFGSERKVFVNKSLPAGPQQFSLEIRDLVPGNYYLRLEVEGRQKTRRIVKI